MRILVIPDAHNPFMNMRLFEVLLDITTYFNYDICVILGDWGDSYDAGKFFMDPTRRLSAALELEHEVCTKHLDALTRTLGKDCLKFFCFGNHEVRIYNDIAQKCPNIWHMVQDHDLYGLDRLGWKTVPYKESVQLGHLRFTHDLGKYGQFAAFHAPRDTMASFIIGHLHRVMWGAVGDYNDTPYLYCSAGWIGDVDQLNYRHRDMARSQWRNAILDGYITKEGFAQINPHVWLPGNHFIIGDKDFYYQKGA